MALTRRTLVLGLAATIAGGCAGEKSPVTADNAKRMSAVRLNGTPILE